MLVVAGSQAKSRQRIRIITYMQMLVLTCLTPTYALPLSSGL